VVERIEGRMEDIIQFKYVFLVLKKRWKLISITTILITFLTAVYCIFFITPVYEAETELLASETDPNTGQFAGDIETSILLIDTYQIIIKSPAILDKVAKKLGTGTKREDLSSKIEVKKINHSQVFTIAVQDSDPNRAALIANLVTETFLEETKVIFGNNNVKILTPASISNHGEPIKPNIKLITLITFFLVLLLVLTLAFIIEVMNVKFQNINEVYETMNIKVIGHITHFDAFIINEKDHKDGDK
jgi:capsular polysaccharide biosynthesis protein